MRYVLMAIVIALFASTAKAHDMEQGTGVLCDTKAQIERFASLDMSQEAVKLINTAEQKNACALVEVRYIRGITVGTYRNHLGTVQAVEILVVMVNANGWAHIPPEVQYTLFLVNEEGA